MDFIADHITKNVQFDETAFQWEHVDKLAHQFKRHLRPILSAVDFTASLANDPLIEAISFLKVAFQKGRSLKQYLSNTIPIRFIPDNIKRYLYAASKTDGPKHLIVDRYEFLVYRFLRNGLEAGDIFCRDSIRFRSFEDDLITDEQWQQKEQLIAARKACDSEAVASHRDDTGLTILQQPIHDHLQALQQTLEARITEVNRRITAGENEHFKIKKSGKHSRWTLQYPRGSEPANHPLFDALRQVEIRNVLHFVNQQCQFMEAFNHILGRYTKKEADNSVITACLIAWGTNMGIGRMGQISDIGYQLLSTISDNFIRIETLREANDLISDAIAQLPIFLYYDIGETVHSSSDGQKFETRIHTINARYSPKYFGLKKGIVSYTLVANHIPINAKIIGANDHESHYVFDILFNNMTDIQPEVHSTDTHGTNEVNFAILHL